MRHIVAVVVFCAAVAIAATTQVLTTLVSFDGSNGNNPVGGLVQGSDGNFYGTTNGSYTSFGTIFKMTSDGTLTTLHTFNFDDGQHPAAPLVEGKDGDFYGTTAGGGPNHGGVFFKISPSGDYKILRSFSPPEGGSLSALVKVADGDFYGTSAAIVYKITPEGVLTNLHTFSGSDGASPTGLIQASDGNFYGTTTQGGTKQYGTVFRVTPQGTLTTLYNFCTPHNCPDGTTPWVGLVQGADGNLYGITSSGGANNWGTIFKMTLSGAFTKIYDFCSNQGCILSPPAPLIQSIDGNFYGTGQYGGFGGIFQITPTGKLTPLYAFKGSDGAGPRAGLVQGLDGHFYGTTFQGGSGKNCSSDGCGTVFRFDSGLFPILSVTKTGDGTVSGGQQHIYCGAACSYFYPKGTQISLSSVPAPGYTFSGWTGCDQVNGSYCWVTMTQAKNISANFTTANVTLTSLTFKPMYVRGGQLSAGTLKLNAPAPPGGVTVALSSDHPGVAHPPSFVFVPGGKSSVGFAVNTFPVKGNITVTITAAAGGSHVSGTLMVGTTALPQSIK